MQRFMLYAHRNTASDNKSAMWAESTAKGGVKERRISSIYTLNFETKSILSDRAWVNLESSGIFFCIFLGFYYKIL